MDPSTLAPSKIWRKMISETLSKHDGLQTGRWNDFKIYLDNAHGAAGTSAQDAAGNRMSDGDCMYIFCTECKALDFDAKFAFHFNGSRCCKSVPDNLDNRETRQNAFNFNCPNGHCISVDGTINNMCSCPLL